MLQLNALNSGFEIVALLRPKSRHGRKRIQNLAGRGVGTSFCKQSHTEIPVLRDSHLHASFTIDQSVSRELPHPPLAEIGALSPTCNHCGVSTDNGIEPQYLPISMFRSRSPPDRCRYEHVGESTPRATCDLPNQRAEAAIGCRVFEVGTPESIGNSNSEGLNATRRSVGGLLC